ncbi:aliphatic sulfonate ABC transporter substrate-binding protein [Pseudanabaena yagii]|uniref:Aliphatic sulfonate ABC transporter substrate-binding protein n=1 Tax=Pseudanabaena yagii GIHE-NHR1 TaxID=2722753 RepID=A0ABX1LWV8_9CYAN|nr:aliphatic sulfonate ABC transporter substrate-binding protein [Pseudanabaena yagii]NMF60682.1 aliphatic sulfonate ABC transporter substrate-binding protein [Pseudanabaena yagii GIHE-NHR1]
MKELPPMFKVFTRPDQVQKIKRRSLLFSAAYGFVLSTTLLGCGSNPTVSTSTESKDFKTASKSSDSKTEASKPAASGEKKVIRIVRSKQLTALAVLEKQGTLEKAFQPLGYEVKWAEFAAGPQQLEALNANGLDIASTAESPPIFSQAAGSPLVYLGATATNGKPVALLVAKDSSIKSVQDLKGKKIAFQKASIGHYLAVKAFEKEGLSTSDFESVFLPPADASAAFSQGKVDGWFIWDPFITRTELSGVGRVLIDGEKLRDTRNFYTTTRKYYEGNKDAIKLFFEELEKADAFVKANPKEVAALLTDVTKVEAPILEKMHAKYEYGLRPITEDIIKEQERVAEFWFKYKLIPNKPDVRAGFLKPEEYEYITPKGVLALAKGTKP